MNIRTLTLGIGLLTAATSLAGISDVRSFPPMRPQEKNESGISRNIQRAPLNPNIDKGTHMFGYTTADYDGPHHYVNLYSKSPNNLNKLSEILFDNLETDRLYPRNLGTVAGVWAGDKYYAYRMFYYSFGITHLWDWVSADPKTGSSVREYDYHELSTSNPAWFSIPQAMMWNPNDPDNLYVLAQNTTTEWASSRICRVNRANGQYLQEVKALPEYYMSAAFDYDNQLYALRWSYDDTGNVTGTQIDILDPTDDFNVISSTPVTVDGKPWYVYFDNNIAFDYTTGELWWAACQVSNFPEAIADPEHVAPVTQERLIKIDPLTMATENMGGIGMYEHIGGLYIDYLTASSRRAPAQVTEPSFTIDQNGNTTVTLNWTNPKTYWNRRSMTNLSSVEIYRDAYPGSPVATVTATGKEGQKMSWTDESASNGVHTYYIVPVNANGKGVPFALDAFVGKDVPGPVTNPTAVTNDGLTVNLSWNKPVIGDNSGWFDDSDLTYTIYRFPENVKVGTTKETNYHDTKLNEANLQTYVVVASNAQGEGTRTEFPAVYAGNGIRPPFSTTFPNKVEADRFSYIDRNHDGRRFEYDFNTHIGMNTYTYKLLLSANDNDDVLVSPSLLVEKGKTYKVTYHVYYGGYNDSHNRKGIPTPARLLGGTAPTEQAMTDILFDDPDHTTDWPAVTEKYVTYFTAPITGEYFVGLDVLTKDASEMWLYVEGFDIDNAPSDDLDAHAVNSYLYLSTIEENAFEVEVYNNGQNDQSNYTVKLATLNDRNQPEVFAQTSDVPVAKSHEITKVKLNAKMPAAGNFDLVAIVDLPGDGNTSNNTSEPVAVSCDETAPLNFTALMEGTEGKETNIPFHHNTPCTATQTIYTPAMTLLDKIYAGAEENPTITRIAWEGNTLQTLPAFDTQVTVYLTQTDETGYMADAPQFIPVEVDPVASDLVTIKPGRNYAVVDFEEPFEFNPKKGLMVTVLKENRTQSGFLVDWRTFDADWYADKLHSVIYSSNTELDVTDPEGTFFAYGPAPVLHMAIQGKRSNIGDEPDPGSVNLVTDGQAALLYNPATSSVEAVGFQMASVEVYDAAGKLIERVKVAEGADSARLTATEGLSFIKVISTDGKTFSLKALI